MSAVSASLRKYLSVPEEAVDDKRLKAFLMSIRNLEVDPQWLPVMIWPYFFYDKQDDFAYSDRWQRWFIAGNGTGKTHIIYWNTIAYLLGVHMAQFGTPPMKARVITPSFDYVEDTALSKLFDPHRIEPLGIEVGPMLPKNMVKKGFTKDHRQISFKNGSSMSFVTSEQGWQFMRGAEFDLLVVDEECDERVFDENVRGLRNAKGGGKIIAGLTPPYQEGQGPTWTKEKIVDAGFERDDVEVINACMADNPAITSEFIRRFSEGKTKAQVDVQVYGKYPTWGDLVHPDFQDRIWDSKSCDGHLLRNDTPMPDNWVVDWVMAFDWHQSKPCAAVWGFIDADGNLTIFDELDPDVSREKTIDDLSDIFRAVEGHPHDKRRFRRWQDPSAKATYKAVHRGFNAWDAFRKVGIVTSAGKNRDPLVGTSMVNEYFRGNGKDHPRVFIYERCKYLIRGLRNHYWVRGQDNKGKPDPKWSDFPTCLKYIIQEIGITKSYEFMHRKQKLPLQSFRPIKTGKTTIDVSRWM